MDDNVVINFFVLVANRAGKLACLTGKDIKVFALVKGEEYYVFLYDDDSRAETVRVLGRFASNPGLSFTWYDAAVSSQKVRQEGVKMSLKQRFDLSLPSDD